MKIIIHKTLIELVLITLFVVCIPLSVSAEGYSVQPLILDYTLEKREIIEETITITNKGGGVVRIFPTVNEITVGEGGTIQNFVEPSMVEDRGSSITSWLAISRGRIDLKPGESKELTLTIAVNPEVKAGTYHAFIGFPEGSNRPNAEKNVYEGTAPGTVVSIGIDQVQDQFLRLENFTVERFIKSSSEGEIKFTLQNPGDTEVIPKGEIIFYDNTGNEVAALDVNTALLPVDPGKSLTYTETVPKDLKMAKYKAFLSVTYGEHQTASVHDTVYFYVLPIKQIIIIFIIVLLLTILVALYVHRRYDVAESDDGVAEVPLYIRQHRSESKEHDIDLSKRNTE